MFLNVDKFDSSSINAEGLRAYFSKFGEVVEAVIMRDRASGRSRGFGFITFTDEAVADQVSLETHVLDGRVVRVFLLL